MKQITTLALLALLAAGGSLALPVYAASPAEKPPASQSRAPAKTATAPQAQLRVSINSASAEELAEILNGVGLKKAESIVRHREANGPFKTPESLSEVPGIGTALVERNMALIKL
ncbi:ComEA family DNA-binding protein [Shimwellia blattae]|uniref:Competence protein ComEA n=1 Tax=Shimwellia blattae (strain ATCC 29907 / DSM 4481 / JCM 1650 / NBRC 105725 / CDC 9005-74) TaxID=630626 RepID=I2BBP6_SHIBC|nr:helix-hairpin-helix domain-containing protein [Shimwellia blattae]AFJ47950.1 hypothetical protein EBL_c28800 [Shimwellia blattae DSM 4481 = NBRC 105725]GAB82788.1 hypothetical protein YbaV [Shimwellia blattae DSM 4481 = NBRC 105725]VDY65450.1 competence protein ComEA helix-hairpin-helix repeat region [Shimwellia blattae]VEC24633.1 competence protein ComEA helix-hairpin-helix repeat region [Shimwellia blattae]